MSQSCVRKNSAARRVDFPQRLARIALVACASRPRALRRPLFAPTHFTASTKSRPRCFCDEGEDVARLAAHEALVAAVRRDGEVVVLAVMERTRPAKAVADALELHELADDRDDVGLSRTRSTTSSGITRTPPGDAGAALVPRAEPKLSHARVLAQHFGDAFAQRAGSLAVNDSQVSQIRAHRARRAPAAPPPRPRRAACRAGRSPSERAPRGDRLSRRRQSPAAPPLDATCSDFRGDRQLDRADGDDRVVVAHLHHAADLAAERRDLRRCRRRRRDSSRRTAAGRVASLDVRLFALEALDLDVLLRRELLGALARFARRPRRLARRARALRSLDRPVDLGARVEQVAPRVLARLALGDALSLADVALALGDVGDALRARRRASPRPRARAPSSSSSRRSSCSISAATSRSCCGSRSSARATTSSGSWSRRAIEMPYDRPGMPLISRYVGASATASNCSDALTTPVTCVASSLSVPRCVVATVIVPRAVRLSRIAQPSAAPSMGSVPDPELVDRGRASPRVASRRISARFFRCALNVERLASIDCSSPTSANTSSKMRRRDSRHRPARECPIARAPRSDPSALSSTVLPPVFGPETSSVRSSGVHREIERDDVGALREQQRMSPVVDLESFARGNERRRRARDTCRRSARARKALSSSTSASSVAIISSRCGRSSSVSSSRMRSTSSTSSDSSSRIRLPNSTAAGGSTNSVAAGRRRVVHDAAGDDARLRAAPGSRSARCAS